MDRYSAGDHVVSAIAGRYFTVSTRFSWTNPLAGCQATRRSILIGSKAIMVPLGLAMATVSILILIDRSSATQRFIYMIF